MLDYSQSVKRAVDTGEVIRIVYHRKCTLHRPQLPATAIHSLSLVMGRVGGRESPQVGIPIFSLECPQTSLFQVYLLLQSCTLNTYFKRHSQECTYRMSGTRWMGTWDQQSPAAACRGPVLLQDGGMCDCVPIAFAGS